MDREALSPEQIAAWRDEHRSWAYDGERRVLQRTFAFGNFVAAFGFMTVVAIRAQELNHHPDWSNAHNTVEVELTTHSAGAVTAKDLELAAYMDKWAEGLGAKADG